tara:strand:- start:712 stop:1689 length:978 start_codon:yes stop_codon:yes gene_type:complete
LKILIYSFNDKLGDGLQKVSFIQNVKKSFPNSSITYTTTQKTTFKDILNPLVNDYIDEIIEDNGVNSSFFDLFKKNKKFKGYYFDIIIDLQKVVLRSLNLKKIPHSKFFSACANFIFSDIKNEFNLRFKNIYIEQFYFNIISLITKKNIQTVSDFYIPKIDIKNLRSSNKINVGIAPGAGDPIREWGYENYIEIAKFLRQKNYEVFFFLGPNEKRYLDNCLKNGFDCPEWENGKMKSNNILHTLNLAKQMDCLLCNDGGTSWIFEFAGIHTFKIFGVTNERKFARPKFSTTIQVKDHGFETLQSFPVELYKMLLTKFLNKNFKTI